MTRRLVPSQPVQSVKDDSGAYVKPTVTVVSSDPKSEISLDEIADKLLTVLYRETKFLMEESSGGASLARENKTALVNYMKLVKELQDKQKSDLDKLSDEELAKLADTEVDDKQ